MAEHRKQVVDVLGPGRLVEGDADRSVPEIAKVDLELQGAPQHDFSGHLGGHHLDGIEEATVDDRVAELA